MKFELPPHHRNVPDEELLADLKAVGEKFPGQLVTYALYNAHGRFHGETVRTRFKGWNGALARAGLPLTRTPAASTEELFINLEAVWRKLGRPPKQTELARPLSRYGSCAYSRRFGGYHKALQAFVQVMDAREGEVPAPLLPADDLADKAVKRTTSRTITWRLRFLTFRRDNYRCRACGQSPATNPDIKLHVDHIIPWSEGGETVLENLQALCEPCNGGKCNLAWEKEKK